mmetsp:Transcript_14014/g.17661  ORF Transcript_14014/g.17661 Transcript_14014/m.17661 type:complete len:104 (+) Transcript_14014:2815-3126(+)
MDTIINFAEQLDYADVYLAESKCEAADLVIIVGTSMSLRHVAYIPFLSKTSHQGKVVMINLQPTPDDSLCDLRIFAKSDTVFQKLQALLPAPKPEESNKATSK